MDEHRSNTTAEIKAKVRGDEYVVDPVAVADALVRRLRDGERGRMGSLRDGPARPVRLVRPRPDRSVPGTGSGTDQTACSYPRRGRSQSTKLTAGGPARTRPIQLSRVSGWLASAVSAAVRARLGKQTQSS